MLVSEIVRRVRDSAGDLNVLQFSEQTLLDWVNDGVRECVTTHSLLQARSTAAAVIGQQAYVLPADIFKLHSVYYQDRKLEILTLEEWEARYADTDSSTVGNSNPTVGYVYAGTLNLWPKPNATQNIVINYSKLPTEITVAGAVYTPSTPTIPAAFHNRLVSYCLAQVALQDEDHYKYQMLMTEFQTGMRELGDSRFDDDVYPSITVSGRDMGELGEYYG